MQTAFLVALLRVVHGLVPPTYMHHGAPSRCALRRSVPCRLQLGDGDSLEGGAMKNINNAGVSDKRQQEINELMSKLRARGAVGDSSELNNAASFMSKPPPPPPPPQPPAPPPEADAGTSALATETDDVTETDAGTSAVATETDDIAETKDGDDAPSEKAAGIPKTTTGVGGTWAGTGEDGEAHKPKVSTWGVSERPADISKAYGGGRRVGVGGYVPSEEEVARKQAETKAKLEAYRRSIGADIELERAHKDEIDAALVEARQLMRYGAAKAAVGELVKVQPYLAVTSPLGAETYLELGMAYVAANQPEEAKLIFNQLLRSPDKKFKKLARQMLFQEEAQSFLKVDETAATDEFAKIARGGLERSLRVEPTRRYALADAYLSSPKRPPVSSISEARTVLRSAAVKRSDLGMSQRILQAVQYISGLPSGERLPAVTDKAADMLAGEWLLGFTLRGDSISFAPPEANQLITVVAGRDSAASGESPGDRVACGSYVRLTPSGMGLVRTAGEFGLVQPTRSARSSARSSSGSTALQMRLDVAERMLGPLPLPVLGGASDEQLLLLDALMCITQGGGSTAVWLRPTMRTAAATSSDDDEPV